MDKIQAKTHLGARVSFELFSKVEEVCRILGMKKSRLIEDAICMYIERLEEEGLLEKVKKFRKKE